MTDKAKQLLDAALQLDGHSIYWLDVIGYMLTLAGDWERGPALIRQAIKVNPFPRRACYSTLWLDAVRRDDPEAALTMAREYAPEAHFWSPLMEAVALVFNNRIEEAAEPLERLLNFKPDFAASGGRLIRRYVKFEELARKIEGFLARAGLKVETGH